MIEKVEPWRYFGICSSSNASSEFKEYKTGFNVISDPSVLSNNNLLQTQDANLYGGRNSVACNNEYVENNGFQYVLAAATSIATKINEDTLTYLNQGQSYEIKLKKLGELSSFKGKTMKVNLFNIFQYKPLLR